MHVLVVEHNPERAQALAGVLAQAGHHTQIVDSAAVALATLARPGSPDLLLVEDHLPDMDALDFLQAAGSVAGRPPVILLGEDEQAARWIEATQLGAADFVLVDRDGRYLQTVASRVKAVQERATGRSQVERMADALASTSAAVVIADRSGRIELVNDACARLFGRKASETADRQLNELLPLDDDARGKAAFYSAVHGGGEWAGELVIRTADDQQVPCIVTLSPIRLARGERDGLVLTLRDVSDRVAMEDALRAANRRLAEQASRDSLTGLYNRAYFLEVLDREVARALRYGDVLSVMMIDLDEFKGVNDRHGHASGDEVLRQIARVMRPGLRDGDVLARYGGDEFCVLLPNTVAPAARAVAERMRLAVAEHRSDTPGVDGLTVSIGLAASDRVTEPEGAPADALLRCADRALYASKHEGGDRVTVWGGGA